MKASIASSAQCRSSTTSTAGPLGGEALEEVTPGGEVLLARGLLGLEAEQRAQAGAQSVAVRALGQHGLETRLRCAPRRRSRGCRQSSDDLGEGPEGDVRAEGQAAALAPGDERWAGRRDAGRTRRAGGSCRCRARRRSGRSADCRRSWPRASRSSRAASSSSRPTKLEVKLRSSEPVRARGAVAIQACRGWLLPLRATGWQASKAKTLLGGGVRRLADGDGHRRRRRLQAGGHVDGVAGEEALAARRVDVEAHERLAGVDADAHLDAPGRRCPAARRSRRPGAGRRARRARGRPRAVSARRRRRPRRRRCTSRRCRRRTRRRDAPLRSSGAAWRRRASASLRSEMAVKPTRSQKRVVTMRRSSERRTGSRPSYGDDAPSSTHRSFSRPTLWFWHRSHKGERRAAAMMSCRHRGISLRGPLHSSYRR